MSQYWVQEYQVKIGVTSFYVVGDNVYEMCYTIRKEDAELIAHTLNNPGKKEVK